MNPSRLSWEDRRKFQCLMTHLSATYKIENLLSTYGVYGEKEKEATIVDLSGSGVALLSRQPVPLKATLRIRFCLFKMDGTGTVKFSEPVVVTGEVRTVIHLDTGEYRIGVSFKSIVSTPPNAIEGFVGSALHRCRENPSLIQRQSSGTISL